MGDLTRQTIGAVRFAQILADVNQAEVVLLHVSDRKTPPNLEEKFASQLSEIAAKSQLQVKTNIQTIRGDDIAKTIIREAEKFDLAVLRSVRYRTAGGLTVSHVTTEVIRELKCSIVLLGEPNS